MSNGDNWEDTLLLHLGHWSWRYVLHRYDDSHLIVADTFFLRHLRSAGNSQLHCRTALPQDYRGAVTDEIKKVLVFCQRDELQIIRELRAEHPQVQVISGTYGYALVGRDRYPRLKPFLPPTGKLWQPVNIILSSASAEAEFVAKVMDENGMPYFHEYFGRPFITWLQHHEGFQVSRFYDAALQHFSKGGPLNLLLQMDVLNSIFENTPFKPGHFIRFLEKVQAKVVVVTARDEMMQVCRGQLFNRSIERSAWTKSSKRKITAHYKDGDLLGCMIRQGQLAKDTEFLSQAVTADTDTLSICLEDFRDDQQAYITRLAEFFGEAVPENFKSVDYLSGYTNAKKVLPAATEFKRELHDRLGLQAALLN